MIASGCILSTIIAVISVILAMLFLVPVGVEQVPAPPPIVATVEIATIAPPTVARIQATPTATPTNTPIPTSTATPTAIP